MINEHYPFELPELSYDYDALEPYISCETLKIHHNVLMKNYVDKLNNLLAEFPKYQNCSLKSLITYAESFPPTLCQNIRRYAGGVYNHYIYFNSMTPSGRMPTQQLMTDIRNSFGTFDNMKNSLYNNASTNFGCGYTWLMYNKNCKLQIVNTKLQDTPSLVKATPIVAIDLWEHAFFPQYINNRDEYIRNWLKIVDWSKNFEYMACN